MSKLCNSCKAELSDDTQFCKYCGAEQKQQEESPEENCVDPAAQEIIKSKKRKKRSIAWICVGASLVSLITILLITLAVKRSDAPFFGIDPGDPAFMVKLILGEPDRIREAEAPIDPDFIYYYDTTISGIKGMLSLYIKDGKVDDLYWGPSSTPSIEDFDTIVDHFTRKYGTPYAESKVEILARAGWERKGNIEVRVIWFSTDENGGYMQVSKARISED